MGEWEECAMIISVEPNAETFLPEIVLNIPTDTGDCFLTVPLGPVEAANLGTYLVQTSMAVNRLSRELAERDLAERAEIMDLYAQFQSPTAIQD